MFTGVQSFKGFGDTKPDKIITIIVSHMLCVPLAFTSIIIAFQINPRADHEPNVSKPIIMHAGNSFLFLLIIFLVRLVHQQSLGKVQIEFVPEKT